VFFENRYNTDNTKNSIDFNKKIIVFEDIDCIGDIVMDREKKKAISASKPAISPEKEKDDIVKALLMPDDMITLDDILELWDGIREAPGRIMIISSNHYDDLDPALRRPGRIDITLKLTYASRAVIAKMYRHLIGEDADPADLALINDDFYTPAEIMNVYMNERNGMLKRLMLNQKV
jgi:SpoVK/Ycf46/Vps4 family AAA+-type ATPase